MRIPISIKINNKNEYDTFSLGESINLQLEVLNGFKSLQRYKQELEALSSSSIPIFKFKWCKLQFQNNNEEKKEEREENEEEDEKLQQMMMLVEHIVFMFHVKSLMNQFLDIPLTFKFTIPPSTIPQFEYSFNSVKEDVISNSGISEVDDSIGCFKFHIYWNSFFFKSEYSGDSHGHPTIPQPCDDGHGIETLLYYYFKLSTQYCQEDHLGIYNGFHNYANNYKSGKKRNYPPHPNQKFFKPAPSCYNCPVPIGTCSIFCSGDSFLLVILI
ncbi:hypothetical protein ACTA71_005459 [Dictyostelium dimigraforme]